MATITEQNKFHANVYELATTDRVKGGTPVFDVDGVTPTDGASNAQAKLLADRTKFLKASLDQFAEQRVDGSGVWAGYQPKYAIGTAFTDLRNTGLYYAGGDVGDNPDPNSVGHLFVTTRFVYAGGPEGSLIDFQSVVQRYQTTEGELYVRNSTGVGIPAPTWSDWVLYEPSNITTPVGAVQAFARNTAPTGWLKCNGQAVSRTSYARLFAAIGTTFGAGNGTTTFNLPDLRGEFVRGWADDRAVDTGRAFGSAQDHGLERHNHYLPTSTLATDPPVGAAILDSSFDVDNTINTAPSVGYNAVTVGADGDQYGNGEQGIAGNWESETRPRNIALLYCIRF